MGNITDFARVETRDFTARPFDDVDALVLSQLMYERMPDCVPTLADAERRYAGLPARLRSFSPAHPFASLRALWNPPFPAVSLKRIDHDLSPSDFRLDTNYAGLGDPACTAEFFRILAVNPRFADLRFGAYEELHDETRQVQFGAATVDLGRIPAPTLAVVFRGTDTSLVGWKEDLNMASRYPIPAQEAAARYLCRVASLWPGRLLVMGHSKGGNLAVYAAMAAPDEVADRIGCVYSLDGPGFLPELMGDRAADYHAIKAKVRKIVPEASSVGMIFEQLDDADLGEYAAFVPVKSDGVGVMQHFSFTWQIDVAGVDGERRFEEAVSGVAAPTGTSAATSAGAGATSAGSGPAASAGLATSSMRFNRSLNDWVLSMPVEQRRRVIDSVYDVLRASGVTSIVDLPKSLPGSIPAMLAAVRNLSADDLAQVGSALRLLASATLNNLGK
ncbi:hypothetical protein Uis1B_1558 [Bifidobacterium margollesii]|uniref:DUF2974 domain-containing protein n=1 Tax=Bifidobacterium margollesii TaxID=2020964 RepID=A0A2N5J8N8_9BIFI|nr:Mbeg1-like protein [Bifidobacterium margollesii]PLS30570.1 hypothetical protein Uis1B_1558 [Bifidobacterium margollesii]